MSRSLMSRASAPNRTLVGLLVAGGLAVAFAAAPRAASTLVVTADEVRVIVPIEIDGASDVLIGSWMTAIDQAWNYGNRGKAFHYCGRPVRFVPILKPLPASGTADMGYHLLIVQHVAPGESFLSNVTHDAGTRPTDRNRNGFIADTASGSVVAHEFGHYLGLGDEYYLQDANRNGQRDDGEVTPPSTLAHSDAAESLMATTSGTVLPRHIDAALAEHGIDEVLTCPTEILVRGVYTAQPAVAGCNGERATIEAKVTGAVSKAGVNATGPMSITWRALNRCPGTLFGGYRVAPGTTSTLTLKAADELTVGHAVTVSTTGQHESLFTSGKLIGTGNFVSQWPSVVKGTNVKGTLASFVVPHDEWVTGAVFRFENREGVLGPKGDMRLWGSATVEVCQTSSDGPFRGCVTGGGSTGAGG